MALDSFFINNWRILIIGFILVVLSGDITQSTLKFDINIINLSQYDRMFVEVVIGVLAASLVLYFFIKLISKYEEK